MMAASLAVPAVITMIALLYANERESWWTYSLAASVVLLALAAAAVILGRRTPFALSVGALTVLDTVVIILLSESQITVAWGAFVGGVVAIIFGDNSMEMWRMVSSPRRVSPAAEAHFLKAIRRLVSSILLFAAAVMVVSMIVLVLSTSIQMASFPLIFVAVCVICVMISLTLLTSERFQT
mgnify:CR=1 FL=1